MWRNKKCCIWQDHLSGEAKPTAMRRYEMANEMLGTNDIIYNAESTLLAEESQTKTLQQALQAPSLVKA
jgi:hypothetical protein